MTVFVGLDLAWTARNPSGVCVFEARGEGLALRLLECRVDTPVGFADLLESFGDGLVAAVDAPLIVTPARRAEGALARVYGRYGAYAYSARPAFLEKMGGLAGPQLGKELRERGWELDPGALAARSGGRFAFETYPHAAHIAHFPLDRILPYKRGVLHHRRATLAEYRGHVRTLTLRASPELARDPLLAPLLGTPLEAESGRGLKAIEDQLDAVTCAFMAFLAWRDGIGPGDVFGDQANGCICVPGSAAVVRR